MLQKAVTKMLIKCQTKEQSTFADNGVSRLSEIMSSGWTGMYKQCQVCQKEIENDVCTGQAGQKNAVLTMVGCVVVKAEEKKHQTHTLRIQITVRRKH